VEEIIVVMRQATEDCDGFGLRAVIVVLWRGGLRVHEALALGERDLDPRRGSLLVRDGKGGKDGKRREIGMDTWGFQQLRPCSSLASRYRPDRYGRDPARRLARL
jgi:integrase